MSEWKEYRLKDLSNGNGIYGIAAPAVPKDDNKYTYLRITDINDDGSLNTSDLKSVDDPNANRYLLNPNDIVFARTGNSTGRTYFYDGSAGELVFAGFLIKFSLDSHKVNPKILKYYTHSKDYYDWVASFDSGATRGNINAKTYAEMPIKLPPRNIQDRIVSILTSLDEKIETNRKINTRLEELAQALFKSWFIDFEPFGGKMPEDWNQKPIDTVYQIRYGNGLSKSQFINNGYPVYGANGIIGYIDRPNINQKVVLITSRGNGSGDVSYTHDDEAFITNNSFIVKPNHDYVYLGLPYIYQSFKKLDFKGLCSGSAQPQLTNSAISSLSVIVPNKDVIDEFTRITNPLYNLIFPRLKESSRLAALRDTLLPKLMSGE